MTLAQDNISIAGYPKSVKITVLQHLVLFREVIAIASCYSSEALAKVESAVILHFTAFPASDFRSSKTPPNAI